jgi:predicted naringenin-chalcone synthase
MFARCAVPADKLARRGFSIPDIDDLRWTEHAIYDLTTHPRGRSTAARNQLFAQIVDDYFTRAYLNDTPPDDLIHVTCTGYASPSSAQRLVAKRGWGTATRVTHAYHMGCYAALPALRMAGGFIATGSRRVDIVHTEVCSLHLDASEHRAEQLVVHSLFADGFIRYALLADDGPGLVPLAEYEQVLPDSAQAMTWMLGDHGMQMTLARDVPTRIADELRGFAIELFRRANVDPERMTSCVFAVHPGGPKIIDRVRDVLELDDTQVQTSRDVLRDHGNMSSATLPHIWMRLLADPEVEIGTLIPSFAFGPGLTVCGGLFEKR